MKSLYDLIKEISDKDIDARVRIVHGKTTTLFDGHVLDVPFGIISSQTAYKTAECDGTTVINVLENGHPNLESLLK